MIRIILVTAAALIFFVGTKSDAAPGMPDGDCSNDRGWFIRINPGQTEAPGVSLRIGFGGVEGSHTGWRDWHPGEPNEFPVPAKFLHANEIWIRGISHQEDEDVSMCVGFNDHITQKMCFDESEEHETSRGDNDDCGC
jgi:hypothetical protein